MTNASIVTEPRGKIDDRRFIMAENDSFCVIWTTESG